MDHYQYGSIAVDQSIKADWYYGTGRVFGCLHGLDSLECTNEYVQLEQFVPAAQLALRVIRPHPTSVHSFTRRSLDRSH